MASETQGLNPEIGKFDDCHQFNRNLIQDVVLAEELDSPLDFLEK